MDMITSDKNPQFKEWKKLKQRKYRTKQNKFLIEGWKLIQEAIDAGLEIDAIVCCKENEGVHHGIKTYWMPEKLIKQLATTDTPQLVVAIVNIKTDNEKYKTAPDDGFVLILDRIQDPGNMGAIIRTAHGAGIETIYLLKGCADIFNEKVIRSAMGSSFYLHIIQVDNELELLSKLKNQHYTIAVAHVENSENLYHIKFKKPVALILGNEAAGPSETVLRQADVNVKIPLLGEAQSLNVGIAAGVIIYEIVRQLKFDQ